MTDDYRAIDAVVNIWTEEALSVRPDWGPDFFVGKMKAQGGLMSGLTLEQMVARMDEAGIGHGFLIAAKSGRPGLPGRSGPSGRAGRRRTRPPRHESRASRAPRA